MRAAFSFSGATRHGLVALAEGLVVAGIIAALLFALSPIYAPARLIGGTEQTYAAKGGNGGGGASGGGDAMKFGLSVDHPEGTTLNDNEVVYYATNEQGGMGGGSYGVLHQCFAGGSLVSSSTKGLWFPNGGKVTGTAYFFAFGDTCTGVVVDLAVISDATMAATTGAVSNVVTYGTNPLP